MTIRLHLVAASVLASFGTVANDNLDDIERISITSDFREQSIQEIPASVSAVNQAEIEKRQAQFLSEILNTTPNVNFASGASRGRFVQIRGIGERSQFTSPVNPSVALIVDGIDFSNNGGMGTLFDVQQVEVFRGPQVVSIGANALAGAVVMETNAPTEETQGHVTAMLAEENTWQLGGAVGGSITDTLQYRASVNQYSSDGFIENTYLGTDDTNDIDEFTSRLKLRWLASDDLTIDTAFHYIDIDNGYDTFSLDNTRETLSDEPGHDTLETKAMSVDVNYAGWNVADIQTVVSYNDSDSEYGFDEDWSYVGIAPGWEYYSKDNYVRDRETSTIDFRLVSKPEAAIFNGTTSWVVGVYAKQDEADLLREYTYLDADFTHNYETDTYAAYGELDYRFNDTTNLIVGLRFEQFDIDYSDSLGFDQDSDEDMVGGRVMLQNQTTENTMVYGSISRGYKAGGINPDSMLPSDLRTFDAEYTWNYETGVKAAFPEQEATVRMAVFYMDRDDMQTKSSYVEVREDGSSIFIDHINNANGDSHNYGVELESTWQATDSLSFVGNVGYLTTKTDERADGEDDQAHAPNYQFYLSATYDISENFYANVEFEGKDEFYFSDSHDEQSGSYQLLHASINYSMDDWLFTIWGRNITDEDYEVRGFGGFGNDPRKEYIEEPYYQYGNPQQFGVTANYSF